MCRSHPLMPFPPMSSKMGVMSSFHSSWIGSLSPLENRTEESASRSMALGLQGATVLFGKNEATGVLVMDESQINCDVPASEPGLVDVRVILQDGQEAVLQKAISIEAR